MFNLISKHPSNRLLVGAIDGELSTPRAAAVEAHLRHCEPCRARFTALATLGQEVTHLLRDEPGPMLSSGLRDRLRTQMTDEAAKWNQSRWFRLRRAFGALSFAARLGVSAAVLGFAIETMWLYKPMGHTAPSVDGAVTALPIHSLTPGAVGPVGLDALCAGRVVERPPVAATVRDIVLHGYRMEQVAPSEYELDYLITPELGGVSDAKNLWPERYDVGVWNPYVKDDLERLLPRLVCDGTIDLGDAQREIATDWISAYKKYFRTDKPLPRRAGLADHHEDGGHRQPVRLDVVWILPTRNAPLQAWR